MLTALCVVAVGTAGAAAEGVAITSPVDGATISRSADPSIDFGGSVSFAQPVPVDRTLYLRHEGCGAGAPPRYLSEESGPNGGNACVTLPGFLLTLLPAEDDYFDQFPSDSDAVNFPITLDASRNISGEISVRGNTDTPNWQVFDVEVRLGSTTLPRQRFDDSAPQVTSSRTFDIDIDIPDSLDKVDVQDVTVTVYYQQNIATWVELNDPESFIQVPSYSDSFQREVRLQVDTEPQFAATLNDSLTGWDEARPTPAVGDHTLTARAVQGGTVRATVTHNFSVTP